MEQKDVCLGIDHAGEDEDDIDGGDRREDEEGECRESEDEIDQGEEGLGTGDAEKDGDSVDPKSPVPIHIPYVEKNGVDEDEGGEEQDDCQCDDGRSCTIDIYGKKGRGECPGDSNKQALYHGDLLESAVPASRRQEWSAVDQPCYKRYG